MTPPPAQKRRSRIPRAVSQPPRRTPPPTQSPEPKEEERVITTQAGDTPLSPPRRSRRLAGQGPEVKPLPLTVTRRAIPAGKVKKTRMIFESAGSTTPSPNPNPKPVIAIAASTPPAGESITNGLQTPPVDSPALMTITTATAVSDQSANPLSATQPTHPSLDAPANPFLALSATPIAPLAAVHLPPAIASHPGIPASPETPIPTHNGASSHVHRVQVLDLSRTGTPGPAKTPLTRAELIGFDPLAPAETPNPSRSPLALASGSDAHHGALIKAEPKAKSLPAPPASHSPLKNSSSPSMRSPPASADHPDSSSPPKAASPSFTPQSPPLYRALSPSTAAHWVALFEEVAVTELSQPADAETEDEASQPAPTTLQPGADCQDDDDDNDSTPIEPVWSDVKSEDGESDDSWSPDNASSPSPTPPPPRPVSTPPRPTFTTARRTGGRPLPPRPTAAVAAPSATPPAATRPRAGENSPQFFTPPTHFPVPTTPAGTAMPPTRPRAVRAHRTAKSAPDSIPLGPARTVAFKAAPPPPMLTRARAQAAAQPATTMLTRSQARATAVAPAGLAPTRQNPALSATRPPSQALSADPMRGVRSTRGSTHHLPAAAIPPPPHGTPALSFPFPTVTATDLFPGIKASPVTPIASPNPRLHPAGPHFDPNLASTSTAPIQMPRDADRHDAERPDDDHHDDDRSDADEDDALPSYSRAQRDV
ncbi:hypothetical protein HDU96_002242, partial [Phlyctochytrium bullatum]